MAKGDGSSDYLSPVEKEKLIQSLNRLKRECTEQIKEKKKLLKVRDREGEETFYATEGLNRLTNRLHLLNSALEKTKSGELGICKECGGKIKIKRILAKPWVELCIDCKSESEQKLKRTANGIHTVETQQRSNRSSFAYHY